MHFRGIATVTIEDGSTTDPEIGGNSTTDLETGDVVIDSSSSYEYVWDGSKWERLGQDASTTYDSGTIATNQWVANIQQNSDRTITTTLGTLDTSGTWSGVAEKANAANITSIDNAIVRFDGTEGKFQNSTVIIDDNGYINSKQFKTNSSETILNDVGYITIYPYDRNTYGNTTPTPAKFIFTEKAYTTGVPAKTLIGWSGIDNIKINNFIGALKGNADTATKWAAAQKVYVTLGTADTTTTIQGGSPSAQTIGVDGILGTANGGTGNTSYTASRLVYTNTDTKFATGTLESDGNNITLSANYSISKPGKSVSWYQGRDYALIRITSINGYTPLASIKTTNGSWDIGHYDSETWVDKLLFNYITDTTYAANSSDTTNYNKKYGWVEMLKDGSMTIGETDNIRDNTAFKNTLLIANNRDQESSYATLTESKPSFGIGFKFRWQDGYAGTLAGIYGVGLGSWRAGLAFRIKKTVGTADAPGSHDQTVAWMTGDGLTIKGKTIINPSYSTLTNNFNEGLRINRGANGWAGVYMGGAVDTTSGTGLGVWVIGTHSTPADATTVAANITDSQLYIAYNSSSSATSRIQGHNANGFSIRPRLTVNTDVNTSYNFYVNGTSYFNGNTTHNGIDYFANGTTYYINNSGTGNLNALTVNNTTASTTTGTGGLIVKGGAGIAGRATASEFNATRPMIVNAGKVYSNISGSNVILPAKTTTLFADGIAIANPGLTAANDVGWLRVTGTAETDMALELATGDDGGAGETIHVRQYNTSNTIVNDLTLLDNQGNTLIPNSLRVSKGISKIEAENKIHIVSPGGGSYATSTSKITGALKIQLPVSWTSCMLNFNVDIYDYATSRLVTYHIGGYNYSSSSQWANTAAYSNGTGDKSNLTVRFGHDGTHCCVIIGETNTSWSYPQVNVRDVYLGYSNQTIKDWETGWVISFITTLPTITGTTITSPNRVLDGTESHLAYYKAAKTIGYTPNITFINGLAADVGTGKIYGLEISGAITGTAANLKAGEIGILQYGDAGPQLRFDSSGQKGAIIFTEYDNMSDSGGASFHFVTNQYSQGAAIRAKYLTAGDNQTAGRIRIYQTGAYGDISANDKSSYGALKLTQAKGNYVGLLIGNSSDSLTIMDSGVSKGLYAQGTIGWLIYGHNTNKTVGIRTSSITSGYDIELGGTTHTSKLIHIDINGGTSLDNSRPLMIGPLTGINLAIGRNAIQARNNGQESILYLNYNAGSIQFGSSTSLTTPTKIFGTVTPGATNTYNLGTASLSWKTLNESFVARRVVFDMGNSPITAGWRRICKIDAYELYLNCMILITGRYSSAKPAGALVSIHTANAGNITLNLLSGYAGSHLKKLRLVSISGSQYWLDIYTDAFKDKSDGTHITYGNILFNFYGNVTVSDVQTSLTTQAATGGYEIDLINTAKIKLGAELANGYWGMTTATGANNDYIRTTTMGLIPYQSGGAGAGHGTLGTTGWRFKTAYIDDIYSTTVHADLSGTATTANNLKTTLMTNDSTPVFVLGATGTSASTSQAVYKAYRTSTAQVYFKGNTGVLMGAAWNDYAEYRQAKNNIEIAPGRVVKEVGDETLELATERLQRGCSIVSNTFGISIGESETNKLPLAVSGRVLAYPYENREEFKNHIGWPVCSGPNGTVSIMTEEEERDYSSRIIGTIASVPDYEIWHGGADVEVNGRVWIKVR